MELQQQRNLTSVLTHQQNGIGGKTQEASREAERDKYHKRETIVQTKCLKLQEMKFSKCTTILFNWYCPYGNKEPKKQGVILVS